MAEGDASPTRYLWAEIQHGFAQFLFGPRSPYKAAIERAGVQKEAPGNKVMLATGADMAEALRTASNEDKQKFYDAKLGTNRHDSQNPKAEGADGNHMGYRQFLEKALDGIFSEFPSDIAAQNRAILDLHRVSMDISYGKIDIPLIGTPEATFTEAWRTNRTSIEKITSPSEAEVQSFNDYKAGLSEGGPVTQEQVAKNLMDNGSITPEQKALAEHNFLTAEGSQSEKVRGLLADVLASIKTNIGSPTTNPEANGEAAAGKLYGFLLPYMSFDEIKEQATFIFEYLTKNATSLLANIDTLLETSQSSSILRMIISRSAHKPVIILCSCKTWFNMARLLSKA
jgi:hypothetical protein